MKIADILILENKFPNAIILYKGRCVLAFLRKIGISFDHNIKWNRIY